MESDLSDPADSTIDLIALTHWQATRIIAVVDSGGRHHRAGRTRPGPFARQGRPPARAVRPARPSAGQAAGPPASRPSARRAPGPGALRGRHRIDSRRAYPAPEPGAKLPEAGPGPRSDNQTTPTEAAGGRRTSRSPFGDSVGSSDRLYRARAGPGSAPAVTVSPSATRSHGQCPSLRGLRRLRVLAHKDSTPSSCEAA